MRALLVTSGKGGTGKSTIASNLAIELAKTRKISLLDADIRAPNLSYIMGIPDRPLDVDEHRMIRPIKYNDNLEVFSTSFFFAKNNSHKRAIIIVGEEVRSIIHDAVKNVQWESSEFIIDSDPSTSDVLIELITIFGRKLNALIVSTNDISSIYDCERTIDAMIINKVNIIGVLGNQIYNGEDKAVRAMAESFGLQYLGYIPFDHEIRIRSNNGKCYSGDRIPDNIFKGVIEAWD
jgi:ATP-binding protein involved in chromosome partitioning